jgi:hypothetical protein
MRLAAAQRRRHCSPESDAYVCPANREPQCREARYAGAPLGRAVVLRTSHRCLRILQRVLSLLQARRLAAMAASGDREISSSSLDAIRALLVKDSGRALIPAIDAMATALMDTHPLAPENAVKLLSNISFVLMEFADIVREKVPPPLCGRPRTRAHACNSRSG